VLYNLATMAKIVGLVWLAVGIAALAFIKEPALHQSTSD